MPYSDLLPRKIDPCGNQMDCATLTNAGELCPHPAEYEVAAHLDNEMYEQNFGWVRVLVCVHHLPEADKLEMREDPPAFRAMMLYPSMVGTYLTGADLTGAGLTGADANGTKLDGTRFE